MNYEEFKKQSSVISHPTGALIGGAIGAGAGLAVYPFTSEAKEEKSKWKRLMHAAHLLIAGGVVGSGIGALTEGAIHKHKAKSSAPQRNASATGSSEVKDQDAQSVEPYAWNFKPLTKKDLAVPPRPYPGDEDVMNFIKAPNMDEAFNTLMHNAFTKYGPARMDKAVELIMKNVQRYRDNYNNKAIEIPEK